MSRVRNLSTASMVLHIFAHFSVLYEILDKSSLSLSGYYFHVMSTQIMSTRFIVDQSSSQYSGLCNYIHNNFHFTIYN